MSSRADERWKRKQKKNATISNLREIKTFDEEHEEDQQELEQEENISITKNISIEVPLLSKSQTFTYNVATKNEDQKKVISIIVIM